MNERRSAVALAALAFAVAAPVAYLVQRVAERAHGPGGDPALVLSSLHVAFYWRAATATWWAGLVAAVAYVLVRRSVVDGERAARALGLACLPLAVASVLVAWFLP